MQNAERDTSCCNHYESKKRIVSFVVTSFSTTEFLQPIKKSFYNIPALISSLIKWPRLLRIHFWRNRVTGRLSLQILSNPLCAISFIAKNIAIFQVGNLSQQGNRFRAIINISGRQQKSHRSQVFSYDCMNFCIYTTACFADAA